MVRGASPSPELIPRAHSLNPPHHPFLGIPASRASLRTRQVLDPRPTFQFPILSTHMLHESMQTDHIYIGIRPGGSPLLHPVAAVDTVR